MFRKEDVCFKVLGSYTHYPWENN